MIVVADTTPLRYLAVIQRDHLLPALYGRVLVPAGVAEELGSHGAPDVVRTWLARRPHWLEIRQPAGYLPPDVDLDRGEREAMHSPKKLRPISCWSTSGMPGSKPNGGAYAWSVRCPCWPTEQAGPRPPSKNPSRFSLTQTSIPTS